MDNKRLRLRVQRDRWEHGITYTELAEYLEIKRGSFYNWLHGYFDFGQEKLERLKELLDLLEE